MNQYTASQPATATPSHTHFSTQIAELVLLQSHIDAQILALELPSLSIKRDYITIGGGVREGHFLSQLHYWTALLREKRGPSWDGWIYNTVEEWEIQTGLTRREQDTVKRNLFARGLIEYRRAGRSGVLHYRLNMGALLCLLAQIGASVHEKPQKRQTDRAKTPKSPAKSAKPITPTTPSTPHFKTTNSECDLKNEENPIAAKLIAKGVRPDEARQQADEAPAICEAALSQLSRARKKKEDEAAWLVAVIKRQRDAQGITPPGFMPSEADEVNGRQEENAKPREEIAPVIKQAVAESEEDRRLLRDLACDTVFESLADSEQDRIYDEVRDTVSPAARQNGGLPEARVERQAKLRFIVLRDHEHAVESVMQSRRNL